MPKGEALIFGVGVAGIFYLLNKEATHQQRQTKNSNHLATLLATQLFGKTDEMQKRKGINNLKFKGVLQLPYHIILGV